MDGAPVRGTFDAISQLADMAGETIPLRLFLAGFELTPTFRDINKRFSVRCVHCVLSV